jgi:uncharacterized protein
MVVSIYPASQIRTDFNLEGFFPQESPTIQDYQLLSQEFGRDDNLIAIAFETPNVLSPVVLEDIRVITTDIEKITNVTDVFSLWNANRFKNEDGQLISEPFLSTAELSTEEQVELLDELTRNPFTSNVLINSAGTVTSIIVELDDTLNSYPVRRQVIADIQAVLSFYQSTYDFRIAGIPFFRNQYVDMLNEEIIMYISISSILIMILLWGLFRNVRGILIPIGIVWLTIVLTVAFIVITGGYFEIMSSTIAPILLCVGVADSIHLLAKYQDSRLNGLAQGPALRETLIILGGATFLTSVTTAIGFGTLYTADVIPMQRFGLYTAAGVFIAFIVTIFVLPTILPWFKESSHNNDAQNQIHHALGNWLKRAFLWTNLHYQKVILISALLVSIFIYGAFELKVNGKIFDDVGEDTKVMQDSEFFNQRLVPQFPLEFVIETNESGAALSTELLKEIEEFEVYLNSFPEIHRTISLTTLLKEIHATMSPTDAAIDPLPDNDQLIAQYMLLLEITDPDAASRLVDFDYTKIRLASNIEDVGSYRVNQMRDEINEWLKLRFPNETIYVSGTSVLVSDLTGNIVTSLQSSIILAFVLIGLIMGWLFKDWKLTFISLIPNLVPLIVTAGVMGFLGVDIKPSTAVIFTIAFGIAVDDSIHFLARLRIEIGRTANLREALAITTEKTGRAIILTSVILATGFGTLATSAFTSTMLMGTLTCLTIVTALLADLFLLPSLLLWMRKEYKTQ